LQLNFGAKIVNIYKISFLLICSILSLNIPAFAADTIYSNCNISALTPIAFIKGINLKRVDQVKFSESKNIAKYLSCDSDPTNVKRVLEAGGKVFWFLSPDCKHSQKESQMYIDSLASNFGFMIRSKDYHLCNGLYSQKSPMTANEVCHILGNNSIGGYNSNYGYNYYGFKNIIYDSKDRLRTTKFKVNGKHQTTCFEDPNFAVFVGYYVFSRDIDQVGNAEAALEILKWLLK